MENQPPRKPVAYDVNAQPIYEEDLPHSHVTAAPAAVSGQNYDPRLRAQYANEPGVVHATRPVDPKPFDISPEIMERTRKTRDQYPHLNISDGEYVVFSLKRHPIGLFAPLAAGGLVLLILLVAMVAYPSDTSMSGFPSFGVVAPILTLVMALAGVGTAIAVWVYLQNQFYLTNESVIQEVQHSLFSRHEQTVSLGSIEDASFKQSGILQHLLNYGTIRLSTEGEETTYRFQYVENPREQVAVLNNAVEAFKNGRPVDPHET